MPLLRRFMWTCCFLLWAGSSYASGTSHLSDSLRHALTLCNDAKQRIDLLLNLKDINEDNALNLPICTQLFREAASAGDIHALCIATPSIVVRYAPFPEKQDSLAYYLQTLRKTITGTEQEGLIAYVQMQIDFGRIRESSDPKKRYRAAIELAEASKKALQEPQNIYQQVYRLTLLGGVSSNILRYEKKSTTSLIEQTPLWEKAYGLVQQMPDPNLRHLYGGMVYGMLSSAYIQSSRYEDLKKLSAEYVSILDGFFASEHATKRRPYFYTDNMYLLPCRRLIEGALAIGRNDLAQEVFNKFSKRMNAAEGTNLLRNKTHLYELGYIWKRKSGELAESILYCDSLIRLMEQGKSYYNNKSSKIKAVYRDRSLSLYNSGRIGEAFDAFARTFEVQDSLIAVDRENRVETLIQTHEMELRQLDEIKTVIRNRIVGIISAAAVVLLIAATGIYNYRRLRRNQRLKREISLLSTKAQESEQMKSSFVNSICTQLQAPFTAIDASTRGLMSGDEAHRTPEYLQTVRSSTMSLLSTLDNMLEAANLDSLRSELQITKIDIDELCRTEVSAALRRSQGGLIEYMIEASDAPCSIYTHARDLSFIVRLLLENGAGSLAQGCVAIGYTCNKEQLRITVTVSGELSAERTLFWIEEADNRLSVARMIADRLDGHISTEEHTASNHIIVFTLPARTCPA